MDREGSFKIGGTVFTLGRKYSPLKVLGQGAYGIVMYARLYLLSCMPKFMCVFKQCG